MYGSNDMDTSLLSTQILPGLKALLHSLIESDNFSSSLFTHGKVPEIHIVVIIIFLYVGIVQ